MKKIPFFLIAFTITSFLHASPDYIRFQGRLTDSAGHPTEGNPFVRFQIFDSSTGGSVVWGENNPFVEVNANSAGLFSADIGPFTSPDIFQNNENLYIEITVKGGTGQGDQILKPRQWLTNVPYAIHSKQAEKAGFAETIADDSVGGNKISEGAISSRQIEDKGIQTIDLSTDAVRSSVINDGSIETTDLADESVTINKLDVNQFNEMGLLVPVGAIMMFLGDCPSGFEEVIEFRNHLPIGADIENLDEEIPAELGEFVGNREHDHKMDHTHGIELERTPDGSDWIGKQNIGTGDPYVYFQNPKLIFSFNAAGGGDNISMDGYNIPSKTQMPNPSNTQNTSSIPPAVTVRFCARKPPPQPAPE